MGPGGQNHYNIFFCVQCSLDVLGTCQTMLSSSLCILNQTIISLITEEFLKPMHFALLPNDSVTQSYIHSKTNSAVKEKATYNLKCRLLKVFQISALFQFLPLKLQTFFQNIFFVCIKAFLLIIHSSKIYKVYYISELAN